MYHGEDMYNGEKVCVMSSRRGYSAPSLLITPGLRTSLMDERVGAGATFR